MKTLEFVYFSHKQGSGYILNNDKDIYRKAEKVEFTLNNTVFKPGEKTTLFNHWSKEAEYIGLIDKTEAVFLLGSDHNLFTKYWYYSSVFIIDTNRIFVNYSPGSGRDYYFINGVWK